MTMFFAWFILSLFACGHTQGIISRHGLGHALVINRCSFPIFLKSCINDDPLPQILNPKEMYRETYRVNPDGGGVSIKIASNQTVGTAANITQAFDQSTITQFEYTYKPGVGMWYDISNVDGGNPWPFKKHGLSLVSSDHSCKEVICFRNRDCTAGYILPGDNYAVHGCGNDQDMELNLCMVANSSQSVGQTSCKCC